MVLFQIIGRKKERYFLSEQKIKSKHNKVLVSGFPLSDSETINGVPSIISLPYIERFALYIYRLYIVFSTCNKVCNIVSRSF